jgi:maleylacetoacetate isomerase
LAIIEYLDETRPQGHRLLPVDPIKRAQARLIAEIVNSGMQPYQNLTVINRISEDKLTAWLDYYLHKGFNAIEEALKETSGRYCVGDEPSIADMCLVPQVFGAVHRFKLDMSKYPITMRIYAELEQLPAFKKAHAYRQPDCPTELKIN